MPAEKNIAAICRALENAGNKNVESIIFPGLNHLFQESLTGQVDEYAKSDQTIAPVMLNELGEWLKKIAYPPTSNEEIITTDE